MKNNSYDMIVTAIRFGEIRSISDVIKRLKAAYANKGIIASDRRCWCCIIAAMRRHYVIRKGNDLICNRPARNIWLINELNPIESEND